MIPVFKTFLNCVSISSREGNSLRLELIRQCSSAIYGRRQTNPAVVNTERDPMKNVGKATRAFAGVKALNEKLKCDYLLGHQTSM